VKIDAAVPCYRGMMTAQAKNAMDNLLEYSNCSCFPQNAQLAIKLYEAAAAGIAH